MKVRNLHFWIAWFRAGVDLPKKIFKSCSQLNKSCQKWQNSDFQSLFSLSKVIRIFLKYFFIEKYDFRGTFFVIDIFWKLQFLNHFVTKIMPIFQSPSANRTLICQKKFSWKSAIFHSIKLPFDAEVTEKILNGI